MRILFFTSLLLIMLTSCKSDQKTTSAVTSNTLPPVPKSFIIEMYEKVDHIDYFFRNTNFSISQDEKSATQAFISMLSPGKAVKTSDDCKSPLRMTFLSQGNILFETEMHMTENCQYVEYYINGVKKYQSSHSSEGYNFLLNLIKQGSNARQQG